MPFGPCAAPPWLLPLVLPGCSRWRGAGAMRAAVLQFRAAVGSCFNSIQVSGTWII